MASVWVWNTLLCSMIVSVRTAPVIFNAPWGIIAGIDLPNTGGNPVSVYFSIPYALPPVGDLRFAKPVAHPGQEGVYPAVVPRFLCPQRGEAAAPFISEDCLTLDVYVPAGANDSRTVMIYIHGGGFRGGTSRVFTPIELVTEHDVIVVVIQYRLGVFGFLASGDGAASGNFGLWDQNLAIRWVKDNIRAFGGDPDSMTIYGQSAGSTSVGFHLLSPFSKGLFSRAILQSGFPSTSRAFNDAPSEPFLVLAKAAGCHTGLNRKQGYYHRAAIIRKDNDKIVQCLRELDVPTLLRLSVIPVNSRRDLYTWLPVVDGHFIPAEPTRLLRDADYLASNDVLSRDVMLGINNDEGAFIRSIISNAFGEAREANPNADLSKLEQLLSISSETERGIIREELTFRFRDLPESSLKTKLDTPVDVLEFFYTKPLVDGKVDEEDIGTTFADIFFVVPMIIIARSLAEAATNKSGTVAIGSVYVYELNHFPARRSMLPEFKGMIHMEDVFYVFNNDVFSRDGFNADDVAVGKTLRAVLADFAKTGFPALSLDQAAGGLWPEFTLEEEKYLSLEVVPRVAERLYAKRVSLWLDLVPDKLLDSCRNDVGHFGWW